MRDLSAEACLLRFSHDVVSNTVTAVDSFHKVGIESCRYVNPDSTGVDGWTARFLKFGKRILKQDATPVCTENLIRVDEVRESPRLTR